MSEIIKRPRLPRGDHIPPEGRWRAFLDETRAYSEKLEHDVLALREDLDLLRTIINLIPVAFFVKDRESRFFFMNRACEEQWGMSFADLRGTNASQFFPPEQMEQFLAKDRAVFEGRLPVEFEENFWSAALQSDRIGYTFKRPIYDANGDPQYLVCVTLDITEQKSAQSALLASERKFAALANTDALTGLSNRRQFLARLADEFSRVQRLHYPCSSLLMLDLDLFKRINDTYGHAVGDEVLKHFAHLMREATRKIDTLARVGGEEFAIILPGSDPASAQMFATRLREIAAQNPFVRDGMTIPVTASIGIAVIEPQDYAADEAFVRADQALYRAKLNGRNCVEPAETKVAA